MRASRPLPALLVTVLIAACAQPATSPSASPPAAPSVSPSTSPAAETSGAPSTAPSPVAAEPARITWSEVPFEGTIFAMIGDGSRFVAVGHGADGTAAWTSTDGLTWEEHAVPDKPIAEPLPGTTVNAGMGQLVRLEDTLYSFGGGSFIDIVFLVVWRWTDGGAWELVQSENAFFDGGIALDLEASDDALLASRSLPYQYGSSTWRWAADTSWVETGLTSTSDEPLAVADFAWQGGTYVAVGNTAEPQEGVDMFEWPSRPAIWTSADGLDWVPASVPDGATAVCAVSARPGGGFVALGTTGDVSTAWTSEDGASWSQATIDAPVDLPLPSQFPPCQIVAVDGGLMATVEIPGLATMNWLSTDGLSWTTGEELPGSGAPVSVDDVLLLLDSVEDPAAEGGMRQVLLRGTVEP